MKSVINHKPENKHMKLPRKSKQWLRESEKVVDDAYQALEQSNQSQREQLGAVLKTVIDGIAKNRGIEREKILDKKGEIVEALAVYLKSLPEAQREWTGITTFLYIKFHQALGLINETQMLKILMSQNFFA
ncbi:MAG TPA: hypothetical protein V6C57_21830 [Coleofasciculaceae cyanobacterium]